MTQSKKKRNKKFSQDKYNRLVLDILEDICGLSSVYNGELGAKIMNLSTYLEFHVGLKEIK